MIKKIELSRIYKTNLHNWRHEKGVSIKDMAFDLGITDQYIYMTEDPNSDHDLSFSKMVQFCNYFDKDITELFMEE